MATRKTSGADKSTENIVNGAAATPAAEPAATDKLAPGVTTPAGKAAPSILDQLNSAQALRDPNQERGSVSEIAYRWGFNDLSHFNRSFRAHFAMTPREWRRGDGVVNAS